MSSTSPVRRRMSVAIRCISDGVNAGATVRRCAVWIGRSRAMNIGIRGPSTSGLKRAMVKPSSSDE